MTAANTELPKAIHQLKNHGGGRFWGVSIDKIPRNPSKWKNRPEDLMTYYDAVKKRDTLIKNGKNASIYYALVHTDYKALDIDPDETTGELSPQQHEVLNHYRKDYPAPIETSMGGVGKHILLYDPDDKLSGIGIKSDVIKGFIPFEIKNGAQCLTENFENDVSIPKVDDYVIDLVKKGRTDKAKKPTDKPPAVTKTVDKKTTKNKKPTRRNVESRTVFEAIVRAYETTKKPICNCDGSFQTMVLAGKQAGMTDDELVDIAGRDQATYYPSKDCNDARTRIESFEQMGEPKGKLLNNFLDQAVSDKVMSIDEVESLKKVGPPKGKILVKPDLGKSLGFKYCMEELGIEVRKNELVGIEIKFPDNDQWVELDDEVFHKISITYVASNCVKKSGKHWIPFEIDQTARREVIQSLASEKPSYNPTREWLDTIPAKEDLDAIDEYIDCYQIDCYDRLKNQNYTKKQIREYYREGFTLMMAGWIMRTLEPGCLFDKFVVLVGETGCGKGLGLALQLPPEKIDPVTGRITPNKAFKAGCRLSDDRSAWYHNRRASLGEVTELVGFSKPGNDKLKAIISATHDHQELKYQNYSTDIPKAYGLVGTTNNKNFKPADGEGGGDRRTTIMDLGYRWAGGKEAAQEMIPKILTDEWRIRAIGHIKWRLEQGYKGDGWSKDIEEMRQFMVGASSKHYPRIEAALRAVAYGMVDYEKFDPDTKARVMKADWEHYRYDVLYPDIPKVGLPFNPDRYPDDQATWMRLLAIHDKTLVDRYGAETIKLVAIEHMGWEWHSDQKRGHKYKKTRNWLIPTDHTRDPEPDDNIPFDPDHDPDTTPDPVRRSTPPEEPMPSEEPTPPEECPF